MQCTVVGTYLSSLNGCDRDTLSVVLTFESGSFSYSPTLNRECGVEYRISESSITGLSSITYTWARGSGTLDYSTFADFSWIGSPSISCTSTTKYDCINGTCTDANTHKTAGIYQSLADCQAVCANGGACASGKQCVDPTTFIPSGKVCIDQGEFASIEALISKIGGEVC
ncbi:hypothetical protein NSTCB13_06120 [Nostoc sp. DSM 114160]|jgi:hypothetical protein